MTPLDSADVARFATLVVTTCACACGASVTISEAHNPERRDPWQHRSGKRLPELRGWTLGHLMEPDSKRPGRTRHRQQVLCPGCTRKIRQEKRALDRWEKRYTVFLQQIAVRMKAAAVKEAHHEEVEAWLAANPSPSSREKHGVENAYEEAIQKAVMGRLDSIAAYDVHAPSTGS